MIAMLTEPHTYAVQALRVSIKEALTGHYSYSRGRLPEVWRRYQQREEITWVFKRLEAEAVVRIAAEPDDMSFEDLFGDCYNEDIDHGINPSLVRKQREAVECRLHEDGQWIMCAEFLTPDCAPFEPDSWETTDSIGGFVGEDFWGSGYEDDLMTSALKGLFESRGGRLPDYVPSKTGAWAAAVLMGWELIGGSYHE